MNRRGRRRKRGEDSFQTGGGLKAKGERGRAEEMVLWEFGESPVESSHLTWEIRVPSWDLSLVCKNTEEDTPKETPGQFY